MPRRRRIAAAIRRQITERDTPRCAYCRSPMIVGIPMVIEHIIPLVSGGSSTPDNLCLACYRCNHAKRSHITAQDPQTGRRVRLFDPRRQRWNRHFRWSDNDGRVLGKTVVGRTTVEALTMNRPRMVHIRRLWAAMRLHPHTIGSP